MPLISQIGRKHWRTRLLIVAIYAVLIVGAVGMLYPFLLMLAGATKSAVDMAQSSVLPAFLHDEEAL